MYPDEDDGKYIIIIYEEYLKNYLWKMYIKKKIIYEKCIIIFIYKKTKNIF